MIQQLAAERQGSLLSLYHSCATPSFASTDLDLQNKGKVLSFFFFSSADLVNCVGSSEGQRSVRASSGEEMILHTQGRSVSISFTARAEFQG